MKARVVCALGVWDSMGDGCAGVDFAGALRRVAAARARGAALALTGADSGASGAVLAALVRPRPPREPLRRGFLAGPSPASPLPASAAR